jgi:hypothetical protein
MKTPAPATTEPLPPELPQSGGAWVREKDGSLRLEQATDSRPEAIRAALEGAVDTPANDPLKEA